MEEGTDKAELYKATSGEKQKVATKKVTDKMSARLATRHRRQKVDEDMKQIRLQYRTAIRETETEVSRTGGVCQDVPPKETPPVRKPGESCFITKRQKERCFRKGQCWM